MSLQIKVNCAPDGCQARLAHAVAAQSRASALAELTGPGLVTASYGNNSFKLHASRFSRNALRPVLYGKFLAADDGTVVQAEFRIPPFRRVIVFLGTLFFATYCVLAIVMTDGGPLARIKAGVVSISLVAAVIGVAVWQRRRDEAAITRFFFNALSPDGRTASRETGTGPVVDA